MASSVAQYPTRCRRTLSAPPAVRTAPPRIAGSFLQMCESWTTAPFISNHWLFTGLVNLTLLQAYARLAWAGRTFAVEPGTLYRTFAPHRPTRTDHPLLLRRLSQTQRRLPRSPDKLRGPLLRSPTPVASLHLGRSGPHLPYPRQSKQPFHSCCAGPLPAMPVSYSVSSSTRRSALIP